VDKSSRIVRSPVINRLELKVTIPTENSIQKESCALHCCWSYSTHLTICTVLSSIHRRDLDSSRYTAHISIYHITGAMSSRYSKCFAISICRKGQLFIVVFLGTTGVLGPNMFHHIFSQCIPSKPLDAPRRMVVVSSLKECGWQANRVRECPHLSFRTLRSLLIYRTSKNQLKAG
jgi:hypothetical protein